MSNINHTDRAAVEEKLAKYGGVMREVFKHMIALKRWEKLGRPLTKQETHARGVSVYTMARFRRTLQPDDWNKVKAFTVALNEANLADSEDIIIEDVLHRLGVQRLST